MFSFWIWQLIKLASLPIFPRLHFIQRKHKAADSYFCLSLPPSCRVSSKSSGLWASAVASCAHWNVICLCKLWAQRSRFWPAEFWELWYFPESELEQHWVQRFAFRGQTVASKLPISTTTSRCAGTCLQFPAILAPRGWVRTTRVQGHPMLHSINWLYK